MMQFFILYIKNGQCILSIFLLYYLMVKCVSGYWFVKKIVVQAKNFILEFKYLLEKSKTDKPN
jgi:hypothetical protein